MHLFDKDVTAVRRFFYIYCLLLLLFGILLFCYFFIWTPAAVPKSAQGTAADPTLFMNAEELKQSSEYSRLRHIIYFFSYPFQWGLYLFVLVFGWSRYFRDRAERFTKFRIFHLFAYIVMLLITLAVIKLPLNLFSYHLAVRYEVSKQSYLSWLQDHTISLGLNMITTIVMAGIILYLIRTTPKRWWVFAGLLSVPVSAFLFYVQPVMIDPLYDDFTTLPQGDLETEILQMAHIEGIPVNRVYVANKSEKTNAINAYVNGIGSNLRIVLYDTALDKLEPDETLYIMGHEIGHYVKNHLFWSLFGNILGTFAGLYVISWLYQKIVPRWGKRWGAKSAGDLALVPLLLLLISVITFASHPFANAISRQAEQAADQYAVELTQNPDAAIRTLQKLALSGRSEIQPPQIAKIFRSSHPTLLERIEFMEEWKRTSYLLKIDEISDPNH